MNNYNNGRNRNNGRNNNGGGHTRRSGRAYRKRTGGRNDQGGKEDRNFTKFADSDHVNKEREYWPQNDWNYNHYNNPSNYHGNIANSGVSGGDGIFPWQRKNPINPLIIPPQVPPNIPTINNPIVNDKEAEMQNIDDTASNNAQQPSTPQRKQVENQNEANSTTRSRNNSISAKSNESRSRNNLTSVYTNTNHSSSVDKNVETNPELVAKPVPEAVTNCTVKIKQEKQDMVKLKQERNSSSSSSSSEESSSSDEETETAKNNITKIPVVKPTTITTPATTGNNSSLNIKLKPQQKSAVKAQPTVLTPKTNANKKPVTSSSSSSSSSEDEQPPPPPKPVIKQVIKVKAKPVIKQEIKVKKSKKKNNSEDDVVCMGQLENKIILDDDDENKAYSESGDEDQLEELSTSMKATKLKISTKKAIETCMICDKKGHTSFQCQMICKNCSASYHGFRTCPQPANLSIMLQLFMEFCMQQIQNYNPEKQFTPQTATKSSGGDTNPKPQMGSTSTSKITKTNNKLKRKQATTKESKTIVKPSKKRKLSNIRKIISEDNDEDDSDNSSGNEEDSTDTEDSSSSQESLVSANTKRKSKNAKSENISMNDFNLSNFIPNPVNLPLVLNGFPNLTTAPTNVTNPNTSTNALNTLLLTQMFQNVIGSMKHK